MRRLCREPSLEKHQAWEAAKAARSEKTAETQEDDFGYLAQPDPAQAAQSGQAAHSGWAAKAAKPWNPLESDQLSEYTEEHKQIGLLKQILREKQTQNRILNTQGFVMADIEKAVHFIERRSDAAAGLISDHQRHRSQAKKARKDLESQLLTRKQIARAERAPKQEDRLEYADRQIALYRGSCFMPCLQPVLQFYADRLNRKVAKDEEDWATEDALAAAQNAAASQAHQTAEASQAAQNAQASQARQ